jgi:hypothetical protein
MGTSLARAISPEAALILRCSRVRMDERSAVDIERLVRTPLDWDRAIQLASQHGMLPLLERHLNADFSAFVPLPVRERLRAEAKRSARDALVLTAELVKVVRALESEGVGVLPYKGPVLAASLYRSLTLRPFGDLDILVRPAQAARGAAALVAAGFRPRAPVVMPGASRRVARSYYQTFARDERGPTPVNVELHWRLPATFGLDEARCWARARPATILGTQVRQLAPEDLLVLLCAHGFKHLWALVKWICDVSELIRIYPDLDWDRLAREVRETGGTRVVALGLAVAHELLDAELPPAAGRIAAEPLARSLVPVVRHRLMLAAPLPVGILKNWQIRERWRDRATYCAGLVAHALRPDVRDRMDVPLPRGLSFLFYLLRPVLVVRRFARKYRSPGAFRNFWN